MCWWRWLWFHFIECISIKDVFCLGTKHAVNRKQTVCFNKSSKETKRTKFFFSFFIWENGCGKWCSCCRPPATCCMIIPMYHPKMPSVFPVSSKPKSFKGSSRFTHLQNCFVKMKHLSRHVDHQTKATSAVFALTHTHIGCCWLGCRDVRPPANRYYHNQLQTGQSRQGVLHSFKMFIDFVGAKRKSAFTFFDSRTNSSAVMGSACQTVTSKACLLSKGFAMSGMTRDQYLLAAH